MFIKAIVAILALSPSVLCIPGQSKCTRSTVISTTTATVKSTATATPGPVIELIAYKKAFCGVAPVKNDFDTPNFQLSDLTVDPTTHSSNCVPIADGSQSFSYHIVPGLASATCQIYFYTGDLCDDNNGNTQARPVNAQNQCNSGLTGVRSVIVYC